MDQIAQRNESEYHRSQSNFANGFSPPNRSLANANGGYRASMSNLATSRPSGTEEWKKSSSDRITATKIESWKMSGKPRHAQLQHVVQEEDPRNRRQSAPLFNSPYQQHPKPLPQEPSPVVQHNVYPPPVMGEPFTQAPFHLTTPIQQHHRPVYAHNEMYPPTTPYMPANEFVPPPLVDYQHYHHHQPEYIPPPPQQQPLYNEFSPQDYPPQPYNEYPIVDYPPQHQHHPIADYSPQQQHRPIGEYPPQQPYKEIPLQDYPSQQPIVPEHDAPVAKPEVKPQKKKDAKPEKKVRQITVQSINIEHRVWIDVLPAETGLSLAEKIHIIATFRTRKIVSITSASGRKVPLDNRPVFGSWMDMENFVDGERWTVEWRENDRGVVDRFMSKIVQSKRRD
ncbi:hypothetical protein INT47_004746 [Mucor saturninus]|uniref:Uncharacterized protein n=1 Tax=Mucor saturninus TaxID=64648 RepID=A0A8H7QJB2_9FUNG|nr:hypothetical protein INT47_004746 [Mucor saturninus]